jgi:hypothetical protein
MLHLYAALAEKEWRVDLNPDEGGTERGRAASAGLQGTGDREG